MIALRNAPWRQIGAVIEDAGGRVVAEVSPHVTGAANGRLLTAAPRLYEACQAALGALRCGKDSEAAVSAIQAALNRAEGWEV